MPKMLSPHHLPEMLDSTRILPHKQLRQIFDGSHHAPRMPFQRRLAPAPEAILVSDDLYKNPVRLRAVAKRGFDVLDFHVFSNAVRAQG